MAGLALTSALTALYVPEHVLAARAQRERQAAIMNASIVWAQRDWRMSDRDGNGASDYWTKDVYGLYGFIRDGTPALSIDESMALADGNSRTVDYSHVMPGRRGGARHGHFARVFQTLEGGPMPADRFGIMVFPETTYEGGYLCMNADECSNWRYRLPDQYESGVRPMEPGRDSR